jgi:hypothetical protein
MADAADRPTLPTHGAAKLPSVTVDSYNLGLEDSDGFNGDKARRDAFRKALDDWRKRHKATSGDDPLGNARFSKRPQQLRSAALSGASPYVRERRTLVAHHVGKAASLGGGMADTLGPWLRLDISGPSAIRPSS